MKRTILIITTGTLLSLVCAFFFDISLAYLLIIGVFALLIVIITPISPLKIKKALSLAVLSFIIMSVVFSLKFLNSYNELSALATDEPVLADFEVIEQLGFYGAGRYQLYISETSEGLGGFGAMIDSPVPMKAGDSGQALLLLSLPQNSAYFDYASYLKAKNIFFEAEVAEEEILLSPGHAGPVAELREFIQNALNRFIGLEYAPFARMLLIDDRSDIPQSVKKDLNISGLTHLISISGGHFSLLSAGLFALFKKIGIRKKKSAVFVLGFALLYMLIIGYSPAIFRAGFMDILTCTAILFSRKTDFATSLSLSALVQVLINPYVFFSASFILSYSSSLVVYLTFPKIKAILQTRAPKIYANKAVRYISEVFLISLAVNILLAPVLIYYFRRISLVAPISNVFAGLIISPLLLICLLIPIFTAFPPTIWLARILGLVAKFLVEQFLNLASFFASFKNASVFLWGRYLLFLFLAIIIILVLAHLFGKKKKRSFMALASALCLFIFIFVNIGHKLIHKNDISFVAVNAGKSGSFAFISQSKAHIFLCSPYRNDGKKLVAHLENNGVEELALVVLDSDSFSSSNSLKAILAGYNPATLVAPKGHVEGMDYLPYGDLSVAIDGAALIIEEGEVLFSLLGQSFAFFDDYEGEGVKILSLGDGYFSFTSKTGEEYFLSADEFLDLWIYFEGEKWRIR